jgi:hypothetical protein
MNGCMQLSLYCPAFNSFEPFVVVENKPQCAGLPTVLQTSDLTAGVPAAASEQLMHAACAVELLHHAGGIAGACRSRLVVLVHDA